MQRMAWPICYDVVAIGTRRGFAPLRLSAEQVVKVVEWRGEIV